MTGATIYPEDREFLDRTAPARDGRAPLEAALAYARRGWRVVPLHTPVPGGCTCGRPECDRSAGKHPRMGAWQREATTDEATIRRWWARWPDANVGIAAGPESGFFVLDVDRHGDADGFASLRELEETYGALPTTAASKSGGGGLHLLFRWPEGVRIGNRAGLAPGLDVRGAGGQIVVAPSLHRSGGVYAWEDDGEPVDAPEWLIGMIAPSDREEAPRARLVPLPQPAPAGATREERYALAALEREAQKVAQAAEGGRNDALNRAAFSLGTLVAGGYLPRSQVERTLLDAALAAGLGELEARRTLRSGLEGGMASPRQVPEARGRATPPRSAPAGAGTVPRGQDEPPPPEGDGEELEGGEDEGEGVLCTDLRNAQRLVRMFGDRIRFVPRWMRWIVYDGGRWVLDDGDVRMLALAMQVGRSLYREAAEHPRTEARAALGKWAIKCETSSRLRAMVELAQPSVRIEHEDLDGDPYLLNARNGTVDLRTGELRPHQAEDLCSKQVPVDYDPAAACPTWEAFLARIFEGNEGLIGWLQRWIGYCLTGDVREHCLVFAYGGGANGKSTLTNTLIELLGEYAQQAAPDLLLAKQSDSHPTEQVRLFGARLSVCQEIEQGRRWSEVTVKQLTGGDRITARRMREDFWEFRPTHKFMVCANHKPVVRGADEGIWRRMRLVPFLVTIPEGERDRELPNKLRAELPGILAWAVRGCLAWQKEGLGTNDAVSRATREYREEMDSLGTFVAEECVLVPNALTPSRALYHRYKVWAEANGEHPLSEKALTQRLREWFEARGVRVDHKRTTQARCWVGLGLKDEIHGNDKSSRHDDGGDDASDRSGIPTGVPGRDGMTGDDTNSRMHAKTISPGGNRGDTGHKASSVIPTGSQVEEWLADLGAIGLRFWLDGDQLRWAETEGPAGDAIREFLSEHGSQIAAHLARKARDKEGRP